MNGGKAGKLRKSHKVRIRPCSWRTGQSLIKEQILSNPHENDHAHYDDFIKEVHDL
jgi:hypothetical protein